MGRWGAEEKKSANLFGCFIGVAILGLFIYGFTRWYPIAEGRRQLEDFIQKQATSAHRKDGNQVHADIMAKIYELDLPIEPNQLKVEKTLGGSEGTFINVEVRYTEVIDFGFYKKEIPLSIKREVELLDF